jgi:hypothetical protein
VSNADLPANPKAAMEWFIGIDTTPAQRLTLVTLIQHADWKTWGSAWPSVQTMMQMTGMSERAVRKALRDLEAKGHIRRDHKGSFKTGPSVYSIIFPAPRPTDTS